MKLCITTSYPRLTETAVIIAISVKRVRSVYKLQIVSPNNDDNILMNLIVVN